MLGITAVYVTHDQAEAMALGDRIVVMDAGRIARGVHLGEYDPGRPLAPFCRITFTEPRNVPADSYQSR